MTDIECVCVENSVPLPCVFIENLVACRARVHDVYILKSNALYVLTQCEYTQTHTQAHTNCSHPKWLYSRWRQKKTIYFLRRWAVCAVCVCIFTNRNVAKKRAKKKLSTIHTQMIAAILCANMRDGACVWVWVYLTILYVRKFCKINVRCFHRHPPAIRASTHVCVTSDLVTLNHLKI